MSYEVINLNPSIKKKHKKRLTLKSQPLENICLSTETLSYNYFTWCKAIRTGSASNSIVLIEGI